MTIFVVLHFNFSIENFQKIYYFAAHSSTHPTPHTRAIVFTYIMTCTLHDNPGNMILQFLIWTILSFRASKKIKKKIIAFYTHSFTIFDAFVSFSWSECPSDVISLQPEEFTLVLFLVWLAADKISVFIWKCLFVCLQFWVIALLDRELRFVLIFPCSTLMILFCCLLERSAVIHIIILCRISFFPLSALEIVLFIFVEWVFILLCVS